MKKFFEKHDLVKIALGMLLLTLILTWIIPQADFSTGEFAKGEITRVGLFDFGLESLLSLQYFSYMISFIFILGAFYQFLSKLGAYQKLTDSLARKIKGKEILFSLIVSFIIAVFASTLNEYIVVITFIPFIITLCSKAGMDKISSFVATFGAMLVGVLGSTINANIVGMNVNYFSLSYTDFLLEKIIFFAVIFVVYSVFNVLYLKKNLKKTTAKKEKNEKVEKVVKKEEKTTKSIKKVTKKPANKNAKKTTKKTSASLAKAADVKVVKVEKEEIVKVEKSNVDLFATATAGNGKNSIVPLVVVAIIAVLTIILAYIPWTSVFEVNWFTNAYNWVINDVKLFGIPIFSYIFGAVSEFGSWNIYNVQTVLLLTILVLKICYKVNFNTVIDSFCEGFKKVSKLVVILILCYMVVIFTIKFPVVPTILGELLGEKFNVLYTALAGLITNLFTVEYQYTINLIYYNIATYAENLDVISMILQLTYGFVSFFAPSSALLFVGLSYLDIPYKEWMKYIWKFLIIALIAIVALAFII